jgi:hypothetical protein
MNLVPEASFDMKGREAPNLAQMKSVRYKKPAQLLLECPEGQLAKALWRSPVPAVLHIRHVTSVGTVLSRLFGPRPLTLHLAMLSGDVSGLHTASR